MIKANFKNDHLIIANSTERKLVLQNGSRSKRIT